MTESMVQANEAQIDRAVTVTSLSRIGLSDDRSSLLRPSAPRTRPTIPAVLSPQYAEAELATARHGCAGAHTTAFCRAASRNHSALSFGIRSRVSKST